MITGLNHITLSVCNLQDSFEFYKTVLGFKPLMKARKIAYFLAGDLWFCLDEDSATRTVPLAEYTHIAFSVSTNHFQDLVQKNQSSGAGLFGSKMNQKEILSIFWTQMATN